MPKFRSITLSIISDWESRVHPEFPHPMVSASFRNTTKSVKKSKIDSINSSEVDPKSDDDDDVTDFMPRYSFLDSIRNRPGSPTSWGTNPKMRPKGDAMRALFNPEPEGNSKYRKAGIQARPFYFASETEDQAALDGGMIEIKCFRASGRRRRSPSPEDFRGAQDIFGLSIPKGKLMDNPEEARFYDWLLVDAKDNPYASFKFHYRSWGHLQTLSLVHPLDPRDLTRSSSMWSVANFTKDPNVASPFSKLKATEDNEILEAYEEATPQPAMAVDYLTNDSIGLSPDKNLTTNNSKDDHKSRMLPEPGVQSASSIRRASISERPPTPFADLPGSSPPVVRLLPIPPKPSQAELVRMAPELLRRTPSITPSLYSYIDRDSNSESPEPFVGVASAIPLTHSNLVLNDYEEDSSLLPEGYSTFSVESPQRSDVPYLGYGFTRPPEVMFSQEDSTLMPEGYSTLSVESPPHADMSYAGYGIARPPQAMFAPEELAAIAQNKNDDNYVPHVPPTRLPMATFYSDMFRVRTDHDQSRTCSNVLRADFRTEDRFRVRTDHDQTKEYSNDDRVNLRTEHPSALEQDETTIGLTGDDFILRTPSPVRKKYQGQRYQEARIDWSLGGTSQVGEDWSLGNTGIQGEPDRAIPNHSDDEVLAAGVQPREHTSLPLPAQKPRVGARQRIMSWI